MNRDCLQSVLTLVSGMGMDGEKDVREGVKFLYIFMILRTFGGLFVGVYANIEYKKGLCRMSTELFGVTNFEYGVSE